MKIAFASQDLVHVDAHFGWARNLVIYDITPESYCLDKVISFDQNLAEDGNEDKLVPKIDALDGVAILYVAAIGGSGAARIIAKKIHPVKLEKPDVITDILDRLKVTLNGPLPPWLRKALRDHGEKQLDLSELV